MERTVRAWRLMCRFDENELEKIRHRSRCFSVFPDEEGMYVVRGRLDPEVGAMLMRTVDAASDALFRASTSEEIEPKQRRADAVGLLAERTPDSTADRTAGADIVPLSGTRAERYQVVLHVEASMLKNEGEPGRSELEDGTRVSAETSRRLSCDASVIRLTITRGGKVHDAKASDVSMQGVSTGGGKVRDGSARDLGCKTRTIPPPTSGRGRDRRNHGLVPQSRQVAGRLRPDPRAPTTWTRDRSP